MTQYLPCNLSVPESKRRPAQQDRITGFVKLSWFFPIACTQNITRFDSLMEDQFADSVAEFDRQVQEHPEDFNL